MVRLGSRARELDWVPAGLGLLGAPAQNQTNASPLRHIGGERERPSKGNGVTPTSTPGPAQMDFQARSQMIYPSK